MSNKFELNNKRAQLGDTITWFVATIAIVLILSVTIIVSSLAFKGVGEVKATRTTDVLISKSFYSYALTKDSEGKNVYEQTRDAGKLEDFNEELGKKIFVDIFSTKDIFFISKPVWIGVYPPSSVTGSSYFGPTNPIGYSTELTEEFELGENKHLQLVFSGERLK